ncbi:MAG TPA: DNA-3-methyladenine glycosylase I, partial [Nitrosopumilus sp.]|nr:DNA-3-methyladenine glycosylase I [Nitrosopumilus sp.]
MKKRCAWAKDELSIIYHDEEWGNPRHDDRALFEFLILEGAQAGLSWSTILKRRNGYKNVFSDFNVLKVSKYSQKHIQKILQDESIIRNELKIKSAVNNA